MGQYDWLDEIGIGDEFKDRHIIKDIPNGQRVERRFKDIFSALKYIKNTRFTGKLFLITSTEKISLFYKAGKLIGGISISRLGTYSKVGGEVTGRDIRSVPSISRIELFEYGVDEMSRLIIKCPRVLSDSDLLGLVDRLAQFYDTSDFNSKKILEVILFSETPPSKDVLRVVFMSSIFAELQSSEFEEAVAHLEKNGVVKKEGGRYTVPGSMSGVLREIFMTHLAGEEEIKYILMKNPKLIVFFNAMMERGGKMTHDELRALYKTRSNEDIEDMLNLLTQRNAVIRGLNSQGIPIYIVPPDLLTLAKRVKGEISRDRQVEVPPVTRVSGVLRGEERGIVDDVEEVCDSDIEKREERGEGTEERGVEERGAEVVNREEILKKLRIRDPTEEDIDAILKSVMDDTSGADSMIPLMDALKDRDPMVRNVAVSALGKLRDMRAVDPLIEALKDEDTTVRINVCKSLGALGDFKAIKPLVDSLNDDEIVVRIAACGALGSFNSPDVIPPLLDALKDEDSGVRSQACRALGALGDASAIEPLLQALKDSDNIVRRDATTALSGFEDERIIEPLMDALEDEDAYVRRVAASALWRTGDERVIEPLVRRLKDEDSMVRYCIVSAFDSRPDVRVIEPLIEALKDEDNMVRTVAASALGKIKDERSLKALEEALNDEDEWVRNCARDALENLKTLETGI